MKNKLHQLRSLIIILITLSISSCTSTEETPTNEEQYTGHKLGVKESVFFNLDNLQEKGNTIENKTDFAQRLNLSKAYYNKIDEKEVFFAPVRMFGDYPRDYLYTKINNTITERFFTYIGEDKKEIHIHDLNGTLIDILKINTKGIGSSILRKSKARQSELCPTTIYIKCSSGQHSLENPVEAESCNYWEDSTKGSPPSMFIQFSSCGAPILGGGGPGLGDTESEEDSILLPGGGTGGGTPVTDRCLVSTDCDYCPDLNMTVTQKECEDKIVNYLTKDARCVYGKLNKLSLFKSTIKQFHNGDYNLILKTAYDCPAGSDGCTDPGDIQNKNITIKIGSCNSKLEYAAAILHEGIHAAIFKYVHENNNNISANDRPNLLGHYLNYKIKNHQSQFISFAQHQHMQDKYITPIAKAIRKLDNNRFPLKDYLGFAWDGLYSIYGYNQYYENGILKTMSKEEFTKLRKKAQNIIKTSSFENINCN